MNKGFTLLELVIVVAILGIIASTSIGFYAGYKNTLELESMADLIMGESRLAREKASSGENFAKWGIHFDKSGADQFFELFSGDFYPGTIQEKIYISNFIEINQFLSGGIPVISDVFDVQFNRIYGVTADNLDKSIILKLKSSNDQKTITITKEGKIMSN